MIIGICGAAQAGKDTVALYLTQQHGFVRRSFAEPLKALCRHILASHPPPVVSRPSGRTIGPEDIDDKTPFGRWLLQVVGTDIVRMIKPDHWVEELGLHRLHAERIVVPDVRFDNEVRAIRAEGGWLWCVERTDLAEEPSVARHASEQEWRTNRFDRVLRAKTGEIHRLHEQAEQEFQAIRSR